MQKNKKAILSVLLIMFLVVAIIAYVLSTKDTEEKKPINNEIKEKDRFGLVDNYEEFFSIQSTINNVENVEMDTSYFVKEIYINTISSTYYYFIRCTKYAEFDDPIDKYLILILDNETKSYELTEIDEHVNNLEKFARNYILEEKTINSYNKLSNADDSLKNILTIYMEYFKILLIKDPYYAYNMLTDDTKEKYVDYNDFDANIINIYESLASGIFSISLEEENTDDDGKVYYFENDNRIQIQIYEDSIMNFKLSY